MSGRMTLGSLFVLAALMPGLCQAQGGYGYGPSAGPASWQGQSAMPPQYQPQYPGCPAPPAAPTNTIYEQLPDDLGFGYDDTPLEIALKNLFRHSYYRGEYLLWNGSRPGNVLLGADPPGGFIPGTLVNPVPPNTFTVTGNPLTGNPATAIEPSLSAFDVKNMNGYRGTIGTYIGPGAAEFSAFILQNRKNEFDGTSLITPEIPADLLANPPILVPIPANFIGQPITIAGVPTTMLYMNEYFAVMQTSIWGAEANYVLDAPNAGTGDFLTISPIFGFRYFNYRESLLQRGDYQFVTDPTTNPVTTSPEARAIYSASNNNSYGPQIGVRAEVGTTRLKFGAEPKVMLGLNTYTAALSTINVPFDDPANNLNQSFHKKSTTFSPIADLKLYTRIALSQHAHVFAAYNVMFVGQISRPYDTMGYNILADGTGLFNPHHTDTIIQGLSVGGELRF